MMTRSPPWQYEWKRPEWQSPAAKDDDEFAVEGVPVSSASAQVSFDELQANASLESQKEDGTSLLLTATLYATGKTSTATDTKSADVLLLELVQHKRSGAKRLEHRMLRWPSLSNKQEEKSWWIKKPSQVALVAVTLCRLPTAASKQEMSSVDAMDAVALLSLGLDSHTVQQPENINVEPIQSLTSNDDDDDKESTAAEQLLMACLTTDGRVWLYNPIDILQSDNTRKEGIGNGLASLFLGNDVHEQLQQSVLPLSQPLAIVPLSVPIKKEQKSSQKQDNLTVIPEKLVPDEEYDEVDAEKQNLWEASFWDANVEASTAKYHSVDNVPFLLIPAFDFIAVAGRGTRIRRMKRRNTTASRKSSVSSWETSSSQQEEWELGAEKARADSIGSGSWQESQVDTLPADDDESKQTRKRDEGSKTKWVEYKEPGGFVTFISLRHKAESRTVYLPFAPKQISAIVWGGMYFVIVLGDETLATTRAPLAAAIRVDSFDVTSIRQGEAPNLAPSDSKDGDTPRTSPADTKTSKRKQMCIIRRFQLIPILLPVRGSTSSELVTAMTVSSTLTDPPAIVLQYSSDPGMSGDLIVTLNSLQAVDVVPTILTNRATGGYRRFGKQAERALAIRTRQLKQGHVARIPHTAAPSTTRHTWCCAGQGWSLFGVDDEVFFVCWEGSTVIDGAFVTKIHSEEEYESKVDSLTTLRLFAPVVSYVLPLQSSANYGRLAPGINNDGMRSSNLPLPFTSPYKMPSFAKQEQSPRIVNDVEDIVQDALDSLANDNISSDSESSEQRQSLSYRERSVRLVRRCSSWNLLGDTEESKTYYNSQIPVVVVQLGPLLREHFVLSLREVVVENETASPFNQVLGWLSQSKDYYTAASVALDLIRDVQCLRDLRREKEVVASVGKKRANLEGLLDGIVPLYSESESSGQVAPSPGQSVLTQLADMSVGCLLKGGLSMSSTLEMFVNRNPNYDPGRACLMLVSAAVSTLSRDPKTIKSVMGAHYQWPADDKISTSELVWPLQSLFRVGVARDYMATILQLLNAAIPDDLRNSGLARENPDSLEICRSIVSMIVASSAAELMLDLKDETTGKRFWQSLDYDTRLDLALISIDGAFPLLRQAEVRSWALDEMDKCIKANGTHDSGLPNKWLKTLCEACLVNAGCNLDCVTRDASSGEESESSSEIEDDDGTKKHFETNRLSIEALSSSPGSGGLDYDLLIPALLLLANRQVLWYDNACLSTQNVLDAACYLAGRPRKEEPAFSFDGPMLMKQCAMSGNISAGANLIGGKNGLVLQCCAILIKGAGTSMDDAEDYILNDDLSETKLWTEAKHDKKQQVSDQSSPFTLTDQHRSVLWLLEEYVLSIKTFGDFDTTHVRGKVDPVFAARACFRTWFLLSLKQTTQATSWLVNWLRAHLGMTQGQVSPKRLACSALTCALLWPTSETLVDAAELDEAADETLLAHVLNMESLFLVQLSQACCGLVEAVPPSLAHEILRQVEEGEAKQQQQAWPSFQVDV